MMTNLNEVINVISENEKQSIVSINEITEPIQSKEVVALTVIKGGTSYDSYIAGEPISGARVIVAIDGLAYHADITNPVHRDMVVGISRTAATSGGVFDVATRGKFYYYGLGLTANEAYTFDNTGKLVQSYPNGSFYQLIGNAVDQDTININISTTIGLQ